MPQSEAHYTLARHVENKGWPVCGRQGRFYQSYVTLAPANRGWVVQPVQPFTGSYSAGAFPCKQQIPDKGVRLRFYSSPSLRGGRFENRMRGIHRREEQLAARASAHLDQNTAHLLWAGLTGPHEVDRVASRRWPKPSRVNSGQPARPRTQVSLQRTMSSTPWPGAEQTPEDSPSNAQDGMGRHPAAALAV